MSLACVFGLAGQRLGDAERAFFKDADPWGFILFRRNIANADQVRALTSELRACVGRTNAPVFVDQEGGRVQRLGPPHWPAYPAGRAYLEVSRDPEVRRSLTRLGGRLIAADLEAVGIDVDCAPVLDVPAAGSHDIIGDRAWSDDSAEVAVLGRAFAEGLLAGRVLPVIKHIPGHGRALADSHEALPRVDASLPELERDFAPFRSLSDMPMAMTGHVVFSSVDKRRPATTSRRCIGKIIRDSLGFAGLLISDDLSMKALDGSLRRRAQDAHAAGCDIVLHCNGDPAEMREVAAGSRRLRGHARARAEWALNRKPLAAEPLDEAAARAVFTRAFAAQS